MRGSMKIATTIAIILMFPLSVCAQEPGTVSFFDGDRLKKSCLSANSDELMKFCVPYTAGVQDTISALRSMGLLDPKIAQFCLPDNVMLGDVVQGVANQLRNKGSEDQSSIMASLVVLIALIKEFPCNDSTGAKGVIE